MSCQYYNSLYDKLVEENQVLDQEYNNRNSAEPQKTKYINMSERAVKDINYVLFWIYISLCIIFAGFIYLSNYTLTAKVVILVLLFTYPLYIFPLQQTIYNIGKIFTSILTSSIYDNGYWEEPSNVRIIQTVATTAPATTGTVEGEGEGAEGEGVTPS